MVDLYDGELVSDSLVLKTGKIDLALLEREHVESFYVGYTEAILSSHDEKSYRRFDKASNARQLFYLLGFSVSTNEIKASGKVEKNHPDLDGFWDDAISYLDRFNITRFCEKNSLEMMQTLP